MYIVELKTVADGVSSYTVCDNKSDLSALTGNMDEAYVIADIVVLKGKLTKFTEFCKKEKKLETGNK